MYGKVLINDGWHFVLSDTCPEIGWESVKIPHDWAIKRPFNKDMKVGGAQGFRDRWGIGWYKRELYIDEIKADFCYYLSFDGVFENSTVWVNDVIVGGRKYGYSCFSIDITEYIHEGINKILVKVDNSVSPTDRWYSGCGIYRNVYFESVPKKHLDKNEIFITTSFENDYAVINIDTGISDEVQAVIEIDSRKYIECGCGNIKIHVSEYTAWSAENPVLYKMVLILKENGHSVDCRIGIRDIKINASGMWVNGKNEKLRGVCIHQDVSCFGTAVPVEIWHERLLKLKEVGCNAVRPSHHMFMPEFLDLCDELGFYVYEECFDKWTAGAYGKYYKTEWQRDIECMIKRDRNRPSVIIWGVGNEVEFQGLPSMLEILKNHCDFARSLDNTRPVTCALNPHFKRDADVDISEIEDIQKFVDEADENVIYDIKYRVDVMKKIADIVDIIACNYQEPWYPLLHEIIPDKAVIGTEVYQYFQGYPVPMQDYTEKNPWLCVEENDFVIGSMIWTGFDYLGESMGWPAKGWSGALFHTDSEPRAGAYIMKSFWSREPFVHFSVMDYSLRDEGVKEHWDIPRYVTHWEFPQYTKTVIPFMIASNCEEVKVILNDKPLFVRKTADYPNRTVTGFIPYLKGTVEVIGINGGIEVCRHMVKTPDMAVRLEFDMPEVKIDNSKEQTLLLKVRAMDTENNPVFRESAKVWFAVDGQAKIVGVDNGDIMGFEPYNNTEIHMFRGRASVAVRIAENSERVKIHAFADGMYQGECVIIGSKN